VRDRGSRGLRSRRLRAERGCDTVWVRQDREDLRHLRGCQDAGFMEEVEFLRRLAREDEGTRGAHILDVADGAVLVGGLVERHGCDWQSGVVKRGRSVVSVRRAASGEATLFCMQQLAAGFPAVLFMQ
jgi:hypothetical protein